ncbi:MAG: sodium/solute symporter [Nitrospiraceae bacterium]|nr:sodium/solute symporter [Nitrospiraceae bacterium]
MLAWDELPPLPDPEGVAGPFVGVHNDALIVAGGANFPNKPRWETDKVWHADTYVLERDGDSFTWTATAPLPAPLAYGGAVSLPEGVLCMGGNDGERTFAGVFLLSWNPDAKTLTRTPYPPLPGPCAFTSATLLDGKVYLAGGMKDSELTTAMANFWMLDLSKKATPDEFAWRELPAWPGPTRALNITATQHDGFHDGIYVMSGRREDADGVEFLTDVWEYVPTLGEWKSRAETPRPIMAGMGIGWGQSHIFVLGGADGSLFDKANELKDAHPGFPKEALAYHTITDTWTSAGALPANHVTTVPVRWGDRMIIASGEVRPRVRSPKIWAFHPVPSAAPFGIVNYVVLCVYLLAMVGIGVYFANKNKDTDDYFRGGKQMAWWAAGCSIFATMLSSLTYTGVPAKAFAQNWVYMVGNFMILGVAPIAVYIALPFFRQIDATSAYEYLEKRFNRHVRQFGSASFTLFHIFRMAVVMSLTGYALAAATPLSPSQCVLIMGVLSIIYCTIGGIEAVIWTDTVQTFVLFGGALLAFVMLIAGIDGGFGGFVSMASEHGKFQIVNLDFAADSFTRMAIWVVVLGAFAQNLSSYTADQAVVQRYMTTPDQRRAGRSIWMNAILSMFASFLFFGLGTALFAFYRSHPDKLDPTITTDQIFPLFVAREMPIGFAGLIVAGVFAAAQSTVSTSMNSTATAVVTDFLRPWNACKTERGYLRWARALTLLFGVLGTLFGLMFVDPEVRSLFDSFIKVIGLFMGVLGGLFVLGVMTRRANGAGALTGAIVGAVVMFVLWRFTPVNGYLYTFCGVATCFVVGYVASCVLPGDRQSSEGLTIYTLRREPPVAG